MITSDNEKKKKTFTWKKRTFSQPNLYDFVHENRMKYELKYFFSDYFPTNKSQFHFLLPFTPDEYCGTCVFPKFLLLKWSLTAQVPTKHEKKVFLVDPLTIFTGFVCPFFCTDKIPRCGWKRERAWGFFGSSEKFLSFQKYIRFVSIYVYFLFFSLFLMLSFFTRYSIKTDTGYSFFNVKTCLAEKTHFLLIFYIRKNTQETKKGRK